MTKLILFVGQTFTSHNQAIIKCYRAEFSTKEAWFEHLSVLVDFGGMKRFNILVQAFRNRKPNFIDDVIVLCAGLWNLNVIQNA